MKKIFLSLLVVSLFMLSASAQTKTVSVEDAVMRGRTTLAPKRLPQLMWIKGSHDFSYVDLRDSVEVLVKQTVESTLKKDVLSIRELNSQSKQIGKDTLTKFATIKWLSPAAFTFNQKKYLLQYDLVTKKLSIKDSVLMPEDAESMDASLNEDYTAYTKDFNLFVYHNHQSTQITKDGTRELLYGKSVHRDEFGITKGTYWSPKGNLLAFYRMDQSMVADYPIVDFGDKPAKDNLIKYPMAGGKSHEVTVGIYTIQNQKTVYLKTGEPKEQYLTNIAWSPDEQFVFIAVLNRDQNHMMLNQYNASTGDFVKTLFEENDAKYVEPQHPMLFVKNNPSQFIWQSMRDGHNHLYLYDVSGKLIKQLTKGNWEVIEVNGFDAKGQNLFFTSTAISPLQRDYYSVNIGTVKSTRLTSGDGTHTVTLDDNGDYFLDNFTSNTTPREIKVVKTKDGKSQTLLQAENPLKEYQLGKTRLFTLKSELGDDLYCRMITPVNFDSTKKYPVIVYVYGGPHVQLVTNSWLGGGELWFHHLASKGFIVFTLDNHGSGNRGKAFEQAIFRKVGTVEMQDQLTGVNYLKSLRYVDANRIGVDGWSYGGFMTISLMTRNPGIFKAAVAGGPVIDWSYYEVMYTERYMDTPESNKEGYDGNNLLNFVDKLKGKLMIIHDTSDDTVVWQQSIRYLKKAVDKNIQMDYFVYPGHPHNVMGKDRVHLLTKITDYFVQNL